MENLTTQESQYKDRVHQILSFSYSFSLLMFLIGVFLDFILPIKIFKNPIFVLVGLLLLVLATVLIFWAQKTSKNFKKETITKETFSQGPYAYTRSPTHWGLFLLTIGFGLSINAFFIVITSIISFLFSKIVFLRKEEKILEKKYGESYQEYKKSVKL